MNIHSKLSIVSLICFLSACDTNSPDKMLADAESMLKNGQVQEASITIKNVIKSNPSLLEARELLGTAYLQQGLYLAAQKELLRAENTLSDEGKLSLAETHLWLEEYENILELTVQEDGASKENLSLYKAMALSRLRRQPEAAKLFKELESASSTAVEVTAKAYSLTLDEKPKLALSILTNSNEILTSSPLALQLKFTLENYTGDWQSASATSKQLLSLRPADYKVKTQLATVLINDGNIEEADSLVEELLRLSSEQAYFNQLKGTILISQKDFENATLYLDKAIKNGRSNQVTRLFSAIAHYQLENFEQAYSNLSSIINSLPDDHYANRLYTSIQLRLGYTKDGLKNIEAMSELGQDDLLYIVETSRLLIQQNEISQAKRLIDRINSEDISDTKMLQNIGLLKLLTGDSGISELERNFEATPDEKSSFYILLAAYIENSSFDKAFQLINTELSGEQNTAERLRATGFLQQKSGNIEAARKTYRKLETEQPNNLDSSLFFIEQSIKNGDLNEANKTLLIAIKANPLSTRLLMRSFQVNQRLGNLSPAISQLESAQSQSSEPRYALLYAAALLFNNQNNDVIDYLENKQNLLKENSRYWMLLADAHFKQSNYEDARVALREWRQKEPSVNAYAQSIRLEEGSGKFLQAEQLILEAKRKLGANPVFDLLAARLKLLQGKAGEASTTFEKLPESAKQSPLGKLIEGRLAFSEGDYEEAFKTAAQQYNDTPSTELALVAFSSLIKLEQHNRVIEFTQSHLSSFPNDTKVRLLFANYLLEKDPTQAIEQYTYLINNEEADSPLVLNNLAWLLNEANLASKALVYIEKADKLVPNNPNILSTYAAVLSSLSQHEKAIDKANSAYVLGKSNVDIAFQYVKTLARGGEKIQAKQVASSIIPMTTAQEAQLDALKRQFQL